MCGNVRWEGGGKIFELALCLTETLLFVKLLIYVFIKLIFKNKNSNLRSCYTNKSSKLYRLFLHLEIPLLICYT